jgi:hypothetical protein
MLIELLKEKAPEAKLLLLLRISLNLTVVARDFQTKPKHEEGDFRRLVGFSELQHKLSSQAITYLKHGQVPGYPDDVFSDVLCEVAKQYGINAALDATLRYVSTGRWT